MNKKAFSIISLAILSVLLLSGGIWMVQRNRMGGVSNWMMGNAGFMNGRFGDMNAQYSPMEGEMGMMGGSYGNGMAAFSASGDVEPMTVEETESIISTYLATFGDDNLSQGEIMIFDNHAYVQIVDDSKESGAFELLVDFSTGSIQSEPGPNMMWNTEYGMMAISGEMNMMGGNRSMGQMNGNFESSMMNGNFRTDRKIESNLSSAEAVQIAQDYLDANMRGKMADETADVFPGYYTLHVLENGNTVGMLSVNSYSGQVFYHFWHGELIEMSGEDHS